MYPMHCQDVPWPSIASGEQHSYSNACQEVAPYSSAPPEADQAQSELQQCTQATHARSEFGAQQGNEPFSLAVWAAQVEQEALIPCPSYQSALNIQALGTNGQTAIHAFGIDAAAYELVDQGNCDLTAVAAMAPLQISSSTTLDGPVENLPWMTSASLTPSSAPLNSAARSCADDASPFDPAAPLTESSPGAKRDLNWATSTPLSCPTVQRRQNHACDPCRKGKRACNRDDPAGITTCWSCQQSNVICTNEYITTRLRSKELEKEQRSTQKMIRRSSAASPMAGARCETSPDRVECLAGPISEATVGTCSSRKRRYSLTLSSKMELAIIDSNLRGNVVSHSYSRFLNVFELPMSNWLSPGCIPATTGLKVLRADSCPQFAQLLGAASNISAAYKGITSSASASSLQVRTQPGLLLVMTMLDIVFGDCLSLKPQSDTECSTAGPFNFETLRKTDQVGYALVLSIIACMAQYQERSKQGESASERSKYVQDRRVFADSAWIKARDACFHAISARSFRLALKAAGHQKINCMPYAKVQRDLYYFYDARAPSSRMIFLSLRVLVPQDLEKLPRISCAAQTWNATIKRSLTSASKLSSAIKLLGNGKVGLAELECLLGEAAAHKVLLWTMFSELVKMRRAFHKVSDAQAFEMAASVSRAVHMWMQLYQPLQDQALKMAGERRLSTVTETHLCYLVQHANQVLLYLSDIVEILCIDRPQLVERLLCTEHETLFTVTGRTGLKVTSACALAAVTRLKIRDEPMRVADAERLRTTHKLSVDHQMLFDETAISLTYHPFPPLVVQAMAIAAHTLLSLMEDARIPPKHQKAAQVDVSVFLQGLGSLEETLVRFPHQVIGKNCTLTRLHERFAALCITDDQDIDASRRACIPIA
ncbi:Zn(2)-C6 fungal-type DNA-binding domain [Ceraceosorus bombacis]|uniref:Zn(2)-C6 fungal-type DNA-binding domain n=1 Tax=Ceraceosorus bombacis TaxID=401625 RepID=A0A0P1BLZ0_9BASI|nr:Zn(2)-C6 fungal-type DNA-binding domain [Ceraceosorus bombacis]